MPLLIDSGRRFPHLWRSNERDGEDLLLNSVIKSTAVAVALTWKKNLYEVQRARLSAPKTYDRAIESINAANAELERLFWKARAKE
ncbi:hypothetical protein BHMPCIPO_02512 [Ensifer sesbaniae]|nr:hypothetical protein [Ensifer sesbaniae]